MHIATSVFASYAAGLLSFFAPCGTFLLPGLFAYSFKGKGKLLFATWTFLAGFMTLFLPIGLGCTSLASHIILHRQGLSALGGAFMILMGLFAIAGKGVHIPVPVALSTKGRDMHESWTVYLLGVVFGFTVAGCTAPLMAVTLAMASLSRSFVSATLILLAYGLGIGTPLLVLAALADSKPFRDRLLKTGSGFASKEWRFTFAGKTRAVRASGALAGTLLIGLGVVFIASQGTFFLMGMEGLHVAVGFNESAADFLSKLR